MAVLFSTSTEGASRESDGLTDLGSEEGEVRPIPPEVGPVRRARLQPELL